MTSHTVVAAVVFFDFNSYSIYKVLNFFLLIIIQCFFAIKGDTLTQRR